MARLVFKKMQYERDFFIKLDRPLNPYIPAVRGRMIDAISGYLVSKEDPGLVGEALEDALRMKSLELGKKPPMAIGRMFDYYDNKTREAIESFEGQEDPEPVIETDYPVQGSLFDQDT
jgi:hypothetical protein